MNIPEELLKIRDIDLQKILSDKWYKSIWFYHNEKGFYKKIGVIKNKVYLQNVRTGNEDIFYNNKSNSTIPLTYDKLKEIKNKIHACGVLNSKSFARGAEKILKEVYSEDNFDIICTDSEVFVTIRYPELVIKNSIGIEHTMRDVFIKYSFYLDKYSNSLSNIQFARTTYTETEIFADYNFSHIKGFYLRDWHSGFCYGGTDFENFIRTKVNKNSINPILYLKQLVLSFENYLTWESIEGRPYKYLDKLYNFSLFLTPTSCNITNFDKYIRSALDCQIDIFYTDTVNSLHKIPRITQETVYRIKQHLTDSFPEDCYPLNNDNLSCRINFVSDYNYFDKFEGTSSSVKFKGNYIPIKVIKSSTLEIDTIMKQIHTSILNVVVKTIEEELFNFIINKKWKMQL